MKYLFYGALAVITTLALMPVSEAPVSLGWDKINHVVAFFGLAALFERAYPVVPSMMLKVTWLFFYGVLIELVQGFIPLRHISAWDIVANTSGLGFYLAVRPLTNRLYFWLVGTVKS